VGTWICGDGDGGIGGAFIPGTMTWATAFDSNVNTARETARNHLVRVGDMPALDNISTSSFDGSFKSRMLTAPGLQHDGRGITAVLNRNHC
jgi:hypothetical protein